MYLVIITLLLLCIKIHSKCGIDKLIKKNLKKKKISIWEDKKRFLQASEWNPLRIYYDYSSLNTQSNIVDKLYKISKKSWKKLEIHILN